MPVAVGREGLLLLRLLDHQGLGGQQHGGDRRGVLHGGPGHLHRVDDALGYQVAVLAGGGSALVQLAGDLDDLGRTGDEATGVQVVKASLSEPARWIAFNAGQEGSVVVAKIATLPAGHGYNAASGEYGDLVAQGVIDPVKVTRSAVQNAASIAAMLLTTETLVVEKPEEEKASAGDGHGHSH